MDSLLQTIQFHEGTHVLFAAVEHDFDLRFFHRVRFVFCEQQLRDQRLDIQLVCRLLEFFFTERLLALKRFRQVMSLEEDVAEALHATHTLKLRLELLEVRQFVAGLTLLLLIGFQLIFEHSHLAADAKEAPCNHGLARAFDRRTVLDLFF